MQLLLIKKLKQEMKMKGKKRNGLIFIIAIIIVLLISLISNKIIKKDKMYEARKDIDEIANRELKDDTNEKWCGEVELLLASTSKAIDITISRVEKENVGVTPETTDTLFTIIKDNLHFIKLMHSEGKHSALDENWQDSVKTKLLQQKTEGEYIMELNKIKNKIIELKEGP